MTKIWSTLFVAPRRSHAVACQFMVAAFVVTTMAACTGAPDSAANDSADTHAAATAKATGAADPDGRTVLTMTPTGRDMVLEEMRVMLMSVQQFISAAAIGDTTVMRAAASASGLAVAADGAPEMEHSLPPEFMRLGMGTHAAWDSLAADVGRGVPTTESLARLGTIMNNCVGCHAQFRINVER